MRLKTIMPLACIGVLLFCATGCSKSDEMEVDYSMPIRLSAQGEISTANTRAVSDFPNKEIYIRGVFAKTENDYTSANWGTNKDNCYIIDAAAEPATEAGETYTFNWVIPQYWHLPGTHVVGEDDFKFLTFFAYSPATNDRFSLTKTEGDYKDIKFDMNLPALDADNKQIMPDVLYTYQGAKADRAKNTVHLGKFCHALSQVSLKLELVNVSPNIYLKELSVTLTKSGSFLHDGWLSDAGEVNAKKDPIYTYSTTSTPTDTVKYVYPITDAQLSKHATLYLNSGMSDSGTSFLVLPNDPEALVTLIYEDRTIVGDPITKTNTYTINQFNEVNDAGQTVSGKPASLDRGGKTTLSIKITGNQINDLYGKSESLNTEEAFTTVID